MEENNKQSKNERIEEFLRERYVFRFNTIKSRSEWRMPNEKIFKPVTRFTINSIRRELDRATGNITSADNIRAILESDFSEPVNPITEYLCSLPYEDVDPNAEDSEISKLAATITVTNPDILVTYLTKWLVGVVANALNDDRCMNHLCLVLTGEQGAFKTSWLDNLCPSILKSYLFTGKIEPQNKDVQTLIAEYLFINIDDQLHTLNKRDSNELKNIITMPSVKYRRPYDTYIEEYPHLASFMASVNGNDFLTDPTGSRRFLPFEVLNIDIIEAEKIDIDKVYAEVMHLYHKGFRYWFNKDEIDELTRSSTGFHVQTIEYEMLIKAFEISEDGSSFMTTSEVINYLNIHTYVKYSEKRMGEALRKAGFKRESRRVNGTPTYGWVIRKVEPNPFHIL